MEFVDNSHMKTAKYIELRSFRFIWQKFCSVYDNDIVQGTHACYECFKQIIYDLLVNQNML